MWQNTHTGRKIFPLDFRAEMVDLDDVAHGLAGSTRYGHQCWLTCAQHSVGVLAGVEALLGGNLSRHDAGYCLFHDGSDAYLPDLPRPVKSDPVFAPMVALEERVQAEVYRAFGVEPERVSRGVAQALDLVDRWTTQVERRFFRKVNPDWPEQEVPKAVLGAFNQVYLALWDMPRAEKNFLAVATKILEGSNG